MANPKCFKCGANSSSFLTWEMYGLTVLFCNECGAVQEVAKADKGSKRTRI